MVKTRMPVVPLAALALVLLISGCAPATFVQATPGWKTLEVREDMTYDQAWMKTVDLLTRDWDIEMMERNSGYLRTAWHHGISGGSREAYKARITVKFPDTKKPDKVEVKTEAQWLTRSPRTGELTWVTGFDSTVQRDFYSAIGGQIGRAVPRD